MRFRGRLRSPEDQGPGLPVAVILDNHGLAIEAEGEHIGRWHLADVSASRTSSDQFAMSFGREHMMFEADDILAFSYEALPHIDGQGSRSGLLTKIRTAFASAEPPTPVGIDLRDDRDPEITADNRSSGEAPATFANRCRGTRRDGQPCRSSIVLASGLCSAHDPNRPAAKADGVPVEDPSLAAVFRHLEQAVGDVRAGRMDPDTAIALAGLARAMCATIDADEVIQEGPRAENTYIRGTT